MFWLIWVNRPASAQILDDSTQELYSIRTVRYRLEDQLISNFGSQSPDTNLNGFSWAGDFIYQKKGWFQNLGVFGTAARSLYYQLPSSIGLRNGQNAFDYLVPSKEEIRYYNTLSPHSDIQYFQGARQRAMLRATISQNILPRLNITAQYQRLTALRTINITQSEERQSDHHSAYISFNFSDSLDRYRAWGYYQHLNHLQYETGGIAFTSDRPAYRDSLFVNPEIYPAWLNLNARNRDTRNNWYFSQQWNILKGIFLRTSHFRFKQLNRYSDPNPNASFYGVENLFFQKPKTVENQPLDTLVSERNYRLWENTAYLGFEDSLYNLSVFVRQRNHLFASNLFSFFREKDELLFGAQFSGHLGPGRVLINGEWISPTEYDLKSEWLWAGFLAKARWVSFLPSIIQSEFISKNLTYLRNFENTKALQLAVSQKFKLGSWHITPAFDHHSVIKGIAFKQNFEPTQATGSSTMQWASLTVNGKIGRRFFTENQIIRVFQSGSRISQMPTYAYHSAHWFDILQKKKGYGIQVGINLDWRYDWPSESYSPINGQWIMTENQRIAPYSVVDVFANFRMAKTRIYAKVHNSLQGLGSKGYFAAPNYQSQRRLFEIGLVWYFFD